MGRSVLAWEHKKRICWLCSNKIPYLDLCKICCKKKVTATVVEVFQHGSSVLQLEVHHGVPGEDEVELGDAVNH